MVNAALDDEDARAAALDPRRSFIVQAPAGSGKTGLLIQRYLALLATVEEPEQVVAITFTRKAAAEMRGRVLGALAAAHEPEPDVAPHRAATLALARAVARRDAELGWSLQSLPQRLRIDTLDAFNVALARQLPLHADGVAAAAIAEDAAVQYREAARRTVAELGDDGVLGASLARLLASLDNDQAALERLLGSLLPKREQWLRHLVGRAGPALRGELESALERLAADELDALCAKWPARWRDELVPLLTHAAGHGDEPALASALPEFVAGGDRAATAARLAVWQATSRLLLTKNGDWRRQASRAPGFGAPHTAMTQRLKALLEALDGADALREGLREIAALPPPRYDDTQWAQLEALQVVLVRLAAELKVVFAESRTVDFVELGMAAQRALGRSDAPSELLLALDRRIQHLLVDEFQDTSRAQLALLELLTSGWQPGDGRTLFLVGDPMQSIYRFREADVSLFLRVRRDGVGQVPLTRLRLTRNFRSAPAIVDWVNGVFATVLPPADDIAAGVAGFAVSTAVRAAGDAQEVAVHAAEPAAEIDRVIEVLDAERRRHPQQSIAVLVQSRSHLAGLHERLRAKRWPVHAVEIEAPNEQQVCQDLLGLARALAHLGDRIAWLALLRAPWCGLTWHDLHELVHDERERTIWELARDGARVARLTPDGQRRLNAIVRVLDAAFAARGSLGFTRWIEQTWSALDGPLCLDGDIEAHQAEQFFTILARHEQRGDIADPGALESLFAKPERQNDPPSGAGIEIMTMHRAKGLEFDTVVLLGLGREPRRDDPKVLYWLERATAGQGDDLLLAPLEAQGGDARLGDFVRRAERRRDLAERARVLYVAGTRARERLHLICALGADLEAPAPHTLLAHIWPHVAEELERQRGAAPPPPARSPTVIEPELRRLAATADAPAYDAAPAHAVTAPRPVRPEFDWSRHAAIEVGTVVHRHLQRIAERGIERFSPERVRARTGVYARELTLAGVDASELERAAERVAAALCSALEDTDGRWVLGTHAEARSELRLTISSALGLEHLQLDRTFVENGTRWIVDFKTGTHEGGDLGAFLDSEVARYRPQLERYAAAMAQIDPRPIKLGLYFPLLRAFRTV